MAPFFFTVAMSQNPARLLISVGIDMLVSRDNEQQVPVFAAMFSRTKSPLDKCLRPKLCAILSDMVPFPEPGGPMITARNNLDISALNCPVYNKNEFSITSREIMQLVHLFNVG